MPNTFVQSSSAVNSLTLTFPGPSTAGDTIIVGVAAFMGAGPAPTVTVGDTVNSYLQDGTPAQNTILGLVTFVYSFRATGISPGSGNLSVTVGISPAAAASAVAIGEWTPSASSVIDPTSYAVANGTGTTVSIPTSLSGSNELLVGFFVNNTTSSGSPGTGWNSREYANTSGLMMMVDQLTGSSSGSQSLSIGTLSPSQAWAANVVGLYVPAPAPPVTSARFPLSVYKAIGIL